MSEYTITMNKHRSTWHWFCKNPQDGGFGSTHCGSKTVALYKALRGVPAGAKVKVVTNGKVEATFVHPGSENK